MEKYSRWRDPGTGIQPFLPATSSTTVSPIFTILLIPFSIFHLVARLLLLAILALIHILTVNGISLIFTPLPPLYRLSTSFFTSITCRLALAFMGYWWITTETASPKRGHKGVSQIANTSPKRGDLIITNWTSYVDVLYLAFRHNPTFLLPVFAPLPEVVAQKTGRHTGTGSASLSQPKTTQPQPNHLGYVKVSLAQILLRTGGLPLQANVPPAGMYKTLKEARRRERGPVVLFPEGTTSNGKAILRFGDGVLGEDEFRDQTGVVWIQYLKHSFPTSFAPAAACSTPSPLSHLVNFLRTPSPIPSRNLIIRTLHPSSSPSSPSFLPSEILAQAPGGVETAGRDGKGAWREAVGVCLAETGRVRKVAGMSWVEKAAFLDYWASRR